MSNCLQPDCNPDIPVPTPTPLPPCEDGEACKEVMDAGCVVYTNEPLPVVNVDTNDRLNDIIRKWALGVQSGTQAVSTGPTPTTLFAGNGTGLQPLLVNVRISGNAANLLKVVNYTDGNNVQQIGLEVLITDAVIAQLLTQIGNSLELSAQLCELVRPCLDNACSIATELAVAVQV